MRAAPSLIAYAQVAGDVLQARRALPESAMVGVEVFLLLIACRNLILQDFPSPFS
jgi:hypothetical protein